MDGKRGRSWGAAAASLAVAVAAVGHAAEPRGATDSAPSVRSRVVLFEERLANQEIATDLLKRSCSTPIVREPETDPRTELWYGHVLHRVGPDLERDARKVCFAIRFGGRSAEQVWFDANRNGDFTDDPAVPLYAFPTPEGSRSFLVDMSWSTRHGDAEHPVSRKLRIVLRPADGAEAPQYRMQSVMGRLATVELDGRPHMAMLMDGNLDGLYTDTFADGIFVDLDDDRRLEIDLMSPEFGPFAVPFDMGGRACRFEILDPSGRAARVSDLGPAETAGLAQVGRAAPDFGFSDERGTPMRLADWRGRWVIVYFWASWCSACHGQFSDLRALYDRVHPRGLEIVGVSYDEDADRMKSTRADAGQSWPTTFSGRRFWEDPVGRRYLAAGAGLLYLVRPDGVLEGKYTSVAALEARLAEALP